MIKDKPEDFIVDEVTTIKPKKSGDQIYVLLTKTNWTTQRAINAIARALRITKRRIGFAGTKDKRAVTSQVISIFKKTEEDIKSLKLADMNLKVLGYGDDPISLGHLVANQFKIRLNLSDDERKTIKKRLPEVRKGFINYFGQQRFSSGGTAKIGKEILKSDFESAVKIILSEHSNQDEFDKFVLDNWKNWSAILKECPRFFGIESKVLNYLVKNPTDYAGSIRKIAKPLRRLYVHAFQSLIWNRAVSKMLKGDKIDLPGHQVIIPDKLPKNQELPLPGLDTDYSTDFGKLLTAELKKEKIDVESFNLNSMPELKSWGANRKIILKPKNLKFSNDVLSFELDKGAYATVIISHLTKSQ